ncbi:MAG: hypothetical protein COU85_02470 [Candidatus Portnoybacteria bacterium CG10_big_fil_rev_8_21_14_0_10_44_7]|uniref:Xylose isomerase-like TIM barrel domain-containing protein n=1 Tax=Candidatus Portnoybacteria bacterium CG10_big_fil_rev_8_21_14_0_10_44_7 TaxID=1974816 RepID=A0A2M8KIB3_9BACT|nr:MAG: hypothetical protein COU85_02470 [Candidatus Portnoybacteria bacterium CG10_big_fil_rev_8_21_14_0_10_44_7]
MSLAQLDKNDLANFQFKSLHLPSDATIKKIGELQQRFSFNQIVIHPDRVTDWDKLKTSSLPLSIENMDFRKKIGKTVKELQQFIRASKLKLTLDVNHCFSINPTMELAQEFWSVFKEHISYFHLSGFGPNLHEPLVVTGQKQLIDFVSGKNRPIIIESVCRNQDQATEEFNFVKNYLGL